MRRTAVRRPSRKPSGQVEAWVSLLVTGRHRSGAGANPAPERDRFTLRSSRTSRTKSPTKPSHAEYSRASSSKNQGHSTRINPVFEIIRYLFCFAPTSCRTLGMRLPDCAGSLNDAAKRALRGIALGRKAWLFAGSPRGGERAAFMYSLIVTAKMNDINPQTWLAEVLARMPDLPVSRLPELLPWNWKRSLIAKAA